MATKHKIEIFGLSNHINFTRARCCAEDIYREFPERLDKPAVVQMLTFEWDAFIDEKRKELRGTWRHFRGNALILVNGEPKYGTDDFVAWAQKHYNFQEFRPLPLYVTLTQESHAQFFNCKQRRYVYMDITIDSEDVGRLVIELYKDLVPRTCANFEALCTGGMGEDEETEVKLTYANSIFHRVVPGGWIQGGDIVHGRGNAGVSIFGGVFEDENFAVRHDKRGVVGMANSGRNSNHSQFYITFKPAPYIDGKYVAFGHLVEGVEALKALEQVHTYNERPIDTVAIKECGRL